MDAIYDWQTFLIPLNFDMHGVAIRHVEEVVNHSWRLIRRGDIMNYFVNGAKYQWDIPSAGSKQIRKL